MPTALLWLFSLILQHSGVPLKIKRLAQDPKRFIWAVSIAQSRCINMQTRIGALVQDANMLIPYAGKLLLGGGGGYYVSAKVEFWMSNNKVAFIYQVLKVLFIWIRINVTKLLATF